MPESTMFYIFCTCLYIVLLYIVLHILYLIVLYIVQHLFYLVVQCSTCILYLVGHCSTNFALVVQSSTYFVSGSMYNVHCSPCILYLVIHGVLFAKVLAVLGQHLRKHNMSLVSNKKIQSILEEFFFSKRYF